MKEKLEILLEKSKDKNLYIFLGITLIFFGIFILKDYTVDSYLFFQETWREPFFHLMGLGRVVTAFFWMIFCKTNFNIMYVASFIIAIIATTLSMYKLNSILKKEIKNEKITILISVLIIINFCTLELYMFYEKGIMMLSILMVIFSVSHVEKAMQGNRKDIVIIVIEMFIANCCYQGTVGLFIALGIIFIIKNSKTIKKFIKNNILVACLYVVPALINYFIVKFVFNSARLDSTMSILEKISQIYHMTIECLTKTFDILPKNLFIILCFATSLIYIIKVLKQKEKIKIKTVNILNLIYLIVAIIISAVAPQILQNYVYMVPRNVFSIGAMLGLLLLLIYRKFEFKLIVNKLVLVIGTIFLCIQFYNFIDIIQDHYYTNQKDKEIAVRISKLVDDYEERTGETIKKIVVYRKENNEMQYRNVRYIGDANVKAFATDWGIRGILDVVLNRQLKIDDNKKTEYQEKFNENNWQDFDENQVIIEKDTIHLYVF